MKTAGFDAVVQVGKEIIDKSLAYAYYSTLKEYSTTVDGFEFKIRLREPPIVQEFVNDTVRVAFGLEVVVKAYGFTFDLDIIGLVDASLVFDSGMLVVDLESVDVDGVSIGDRKGWLRLLTWNVRLPEFIVGWLNEATIAAFRHGLLDEYKSIEVTPVLPPFEMPTLTNNVSVELNSEVAGYRNLDGETIAVPFNYVIPQRNNAGRGDDESIMEFRGGSDLSVGLSERGMKDFFDYWWDNVPEKSYAFEKVKKVGYLFEEAEDVLTNLNPFLSYDLNCYIDYDITISFDKPIWDLKDNSRVIINEFTFTVDGTLKAKIEVDVFVKIGNVEFSYDMLSSLLAVIPGTWDGFFDLDGKGRFKIFEYPLNDFRVNTSNADVRLNLKQGNTLTVILDSIDVDIPPDSLKDATMGFVDELEVNVTHLNMEFVISPSILSDEFPELGVNTEIDLDLVSTAEHEAFAAGDVHVTEFDELWPIPSYIAGLAPFRTTGPPDIGINLPGSAPTTLPSGSVHRSGCNLIENISENDKRGYYVLQDAFKKGFIPCPECLKGR